MGVREGKGHGEDVVPVFLLQGCVADRLLLFRYSSCRASSLRAGTSGWRGWSCCDSGGEKEAKGVPRMPGRWIPFPKHGGCCTLRLGGFSLRAFVADPGSRAMWWS